MTNIYTCSAPPPQVNVAQDQLPQFLKTAERLKVMAGAWLAGWLAGRLDGCMFGGWMVGWLALGLGDWMAGWRAVGMGSWTAVCLAAVWLDGCVAEMLDAGCFKA